MTTASGNEQKQPPRHERRQQQQRPTKMAAAFCEQPPRGWTAEIEETPCDREARKRLRLLILKGDYGWRVLPFMTVRIPRMVDGAEVWEDLDLLPNDIVGCALEVNLFSEKPLTSLCETLAEYNEKQKGLPPPHKQELTQRPFEKLGTRPEPRHVPPRIQVHLQPRTQVALPKECDDWDLFVM